MQKNYIQNYFNMLKIGQTPYNKRHMHAAGGRLGLRSARSLRYAPFPRLPPPAFCQLWPCCASPYSGWQNVMHPERYAPLF